MSVMKQTNRALRALAGIDLAAMRAEIERQKAETAKLERTCELIAGIQRSAQSNGPDPTQPVRETILDRVRAFLAGGKEATMIAAAIGAERPAVSVYQAMRKHAEEFRERNGRWRLK